MKIPAIVLILISNLMALVGTLEAGDASSPSTTGVGVDSASYICTDTTTQGAWETAYGADGYGVVNDAICEPGYATVTAAGTTSVAWAGSTPDARALIKTGTPEDRLAACWYGSVFSFDIPSTDRALHQVTAYALDWDNAGRVERLDVLDHSGAVLDTRTISGFAKGTYVTWNVSGHVTVQVTCVGGPNAVVSGMFFGGARPSGTRSRAASGQLDFPAVMVAVTSPAYHAMVTGDTTVAISAPGVSTIMATCWRQGPGSGSNAQLGNGPIALDGHGAGAFVFPAKDFPHGPIIIKLVGRKSDGTAADSCYLDLYNQSGVSWNEGLGAAPVPPPAAGMTVTFADDFAKMPSISHSGSGATYCSRKTDDSEFGDAIFADHEGAYDPFMQIDTYLRIRMTHRPGIADPMGWSRQYTSGLISSEHEDGTGFHATGGRDFYMECRMLYGCAPGTWPAFWSVSAQNFKGSKNAPCDEYDILEGYMPWPDTYHCGHHQWGFGSLHEGPDPLPKVETIAGHADCCQTFHTYGCLVTQTTSTFYFDNVQTYACPTTSYAWTDGMYFMINNALNKDFALRGGTFLRYGGVDDLWVDWVRVYERK